jgi:hypothetical protein
MSLSPFSKSPDRRAIAAIGAHALHAKHDSRKLTESARGAFMDRFEREVDPDGVLPEQERARRAKHARSAYFRKLALLSARARRAS